MNYYSPPEILEIVTAKGIEKANSSAKKLLVLGFMAGLYVGLAYFCYVRVAGGIPEAWGSVGTYLGATVFPVGLMGVLLCGGELITGNMLVVAVALFRKKITIGKLIYNWTIVTFGNALGAFFAAFFFGHLTGVTKGVYLEKTLHIAADKVAQGFFPAILSGIACNVFVGLSVWLFFSAKDTTAKIFAIFFPIMAFVISGFQHVVANMFIIPAAIFSGESAITWAAYMGNAIPVFIGNAIGGSIFIGLTYLIAYGKAADELSKTPH